MRTLHIYNYVCKITPEIIVISFVTVLIEFDHAFEVFSEDGRELMSTTNSVLNPFLK